MEKTKKGNIIHVRLGNKSPDSVRELATEVYGFENISEFVRYAIDHIEKTRPTLGKAFLPVSERA